MAVLEGKSPPFPPEADEGWGTLKSFCQLTHGEKPWNPGAEQALGQSA